MVMVYGYGLRPWLCYDAFARLQIILDPQQPLTLAISAAATKPQGGVCLAVWYFAIIQILFESIESLI